ncbi:MAG: NYN domain-containing protein [Gemmatimonadales bacterium]
MTQPLSRPGRHLSHHPPPHAPNAALLIDFDNVTLGIRSDLAKELKHLLNSDMIKGKVAVQRAYADWRRYPQYIVPLSESSIDLIFAPGVGSTKKNATDIRLAIDAIELVFTRPEIGTFILLSGDSDFSMLVIKLKEYGKYVIGVGIRESASDMLIQNCDEYFSYSDLAGLTKEVDVPSAQRDPWELAREAVAQMARNGDVMRSDRLKQVMQQLDPNFDERNAGPRFSRFSKFVVEAGQRGVLQVTKLENGQYEVAPAGALAPAAMASPPATPEPGEAAEGGVRRGRGRRGGRGRDRDRDRDRERPAAPAQSAGAARAPDARRDGHLSLARAFQLMHDALGQLNGPVPHEALRLRMVALHGREDALLGLPRFLRLLRQANDAEIADVRQVSEGEYEVAPHRLEAAQSASRSQPPSPREPVVAAPPADAAPVELEVDGRNGQRFGVRFRRGSRRGVRMADVPLIGVVHVDAPEPVVDVVEPAGEPAETTPAGRGRARSGRKRASSPKGETAKAAAAAKAEPKAEPVLAEAAEAGEASAAAPRRRARPPARRKAE